MNDKNENDSREGTPGARPAAVSLSGAPPRSARAPLSLELLDMLKEFLYLYECEYGLEGESVKDGLRKRAHDLIARAEGGLTMDVDLGGGFKLTTDHAASSYRIPVLVGGDGIAYGPADRLPDGQLAGSLVKTRGLALYQEPYHTKERSVCMSFIRGDWEKISPESSGQSEKRE